MSKMCMMIDLKTSRFDFERLSVLSLVPHCRLGYEIEARVYLGFCMLGYPNIPAI